MRSKYRKPMRSLYRHKSGDLMGRGIVNKRKLRLQRSGWLANETFKRRYNKQKFSKWISKYK